MKEIEYLILRSRLNVYENNYDKESEYMSWKELIRGAIAIEGFIYRETEDD